MRRTKVFAHQIPVVWEHIKFVVTQTENLKQEGRGEYFNNLLMNLLNDRVQCFARIDENNNLCGLALTKVLVDGYGKKSLSIESLYSFQRVPDAQWKEDMEFIKKFARTVGCKSITTRSSIPRVYELVEVIGFSEQSRFFVMEV